MLPIGVLLLLVLEYRPRLAPPSQAAFMGTLALVLSSTYLLTIVLDYPFSGDVSVSNEPLRSGVLAALLRSVPRRPQAGDRQLRLTATALTGVWNSAAFGSILLRRHGRGIHGTFRLGAGTVRGAVSADGVFRGVWCKGPSRRPSVTIATSDAGLVEWRLIQTRSHGRIVAGTLSYGYVRRADGSFRPQGNWDLDGLRIDKPLDLEIRQKTDPPSFYCHAP
jgi:hypothetical protein